MAHHRCRVENLLSVTDANACMADVRDFEHWDPAGPGAGVTDAADLTPFPSSLADPWLQKTFDRIGDAAASGLAGGLGGRLL